jgi:hypothetical protein
MSELFGPTFVRFYRYIRSSPWRMAVAIIVILALIILGLWGFRSASSQNRLLPLLNWLNLLFIPLMLTLVALWLTFAWRRIQLEVNRLRDERLMVESYLNRLNDLLLNHNLRQASTDDEPARVARAHTLSILRQLNGEGRGRILRFLYDASLLNAGGPIVDLQAADLKSIDLSRVQMPGVNLRNVNLLLGVIYV